jgi:uncharacterized coiled-coil protein SlyX
MIATGVAWAQEDMDAAKASLEKWLETKHLISLEQKDWRIGRELLADRAQVLERELAAVLEKKAQATNETAKLEAQLAEQNSQNEQVAAVVAQMKEAVAGLEKQVPTLMARTPDFFRERVKPLVQRLPKDTAETKAGLPERFQNVIGILNEFSKANGEVTVASEIRALGNGRQTEVKALYIGMGQAYYVSAGGEAGSGRPTASGWEWQPANGLAASITDVMQILQNKATARFVPLPVVIR